MSTGVLELDPSCSFLPQNDADPLRSEEDSSFVRFCLHSFRNGILEYPNITEHNIALSHLTKNAGPVLSPPNHEHSNTSEFYKLRLRTIRSIELLCAKSRARNYLHREDLPSRNLAIEYPFGFIVSQKLSGGYQVDIETKPNSRNTRTLHSTWLWLCETVSLHSRQILGSYRHNPYLLR